MSLLPALPALILIVCALAMAGLRWFRPAFKYFWLVAAFGAGLAWLAVIGVRFVLPIAVDIATWPLTAVFDFSLGLAWDPVSWPLALAVAALALGAVLADVHRAPEGDWLGWASGLLLAGLAYLSVLSGSLATLMVSLAAVDLVWAAQGLLQDPSSNRTYVGLLARAVSLGLVLWAGAGAISLGSSGLAAGLVLLASMLRLSRGSTGAAPQNGFPGRFQVSLRNLAPAAGALVLLIRTLPLFEEPSVLLLSLVGLMGLTAAVAWAAAPDEIRGNAGWNLGAGALVAAAALSGSAHAALAWGVGLILSGAVLSLFSLRRRWFLVLPLIGLWGFSGLPIAPTWDGLGLYGDPFVPPLVLLILAHAGLLLGYLRHTLLEDEEQVDWERWVRLIHPLGLAILPLSQVLFAWWPWRGYAWLVAYPWWPGAAAALLGGVFWWISENVSLPDATALALPAALGRGLGRLLTGFFRGVSHGVSFLNTVLEGEGGVLWALLLMALLVTVVLQSGLRGG